jgi:hypothetical protein
MPDGEMFNGKIVFIQSQATSASLGFSTGSFSGTMNDQPFSGDGNNTSLGLSTLQQFQGTAEAVLFGNKGTSMRCKFRVSDASVGLLSGGIGLCVTTNEKTIDVQF